MGKTMGKSKCMHTFYESNLPNLLFYYNFHIFANQTVVWLSWCDDMVYNTKSHYFTMISFIIHQ